MTTTSPVEQTRTANGVSPGGGIKPRRVVLKLSGEVFGGGAIGVDPDVVSGIARQIATVVRQGVQVAVVVWIGREPTTWGCSPP
jgi:uridylate kinase